MSATPKGGSLPRTTLQILLSLVDGPRHGYGIKLDVEERTEGSISMGSGTLYEAIKRLLDLGWIEEATVPEEERGSGGPPRNFYGLTGAGREVLREELASMDEILRFASERELLEAGGSGE